MSPLRGHQARRTERHSITVDDIAQLIPLPISKAAEELHVSYATLKKRCKELGIEKWPSSHERWRNLPGAGQDAGLAIFPHQSDLQASGQALSYAQQHGYFRPAANCIPQFGLLGATGCSPGLRPLAGLASLLQMSPSAQAGTSQMPSSGCPIDKFLESNPPNMEIRMTVEEFGKVAKSLGEFVKNSVEREFQKQREAEEKEKEKSTTEGGGECANLPTDVQSLLRECLSFKSIVKDVHDVLKTVETSHLRLLEHAQTLVSRGVQEETQGNP